MFFQRYSQSLLIGSVVWWLTVGLLLPLWGQGMELKKQQQAEQKELTKQKKRLRNAVVRVRSWTCWECVWTALGVRHALERCSVLNLWLVYGCHCRLR